MLLNKKFQKRTENFICQNCTKKVVGNGYTNHCPYCLFSKHVDINPGDRRNPCGGPMKPIRVDLENGEYVIIHHCNVCGQEKRNKTVKGDNFEEIIKLSVSSLRGGSFC